MTNPQPGGPGTMLCLASTLQPVWHGRPYQEHKALGSIATRVTEGHKPSNHYMVVALWRETLTQVTINSFY